MKKKLFVVSLLVMTLTLAFSTSVALAEKPDETVGERIFISGDPIEFPAGEPFHIAHGFISYYQINEPVKNDFALGKMILEVDGVEVEPDYFDIDWAVYPHYEGGWKVVTKIYTFNFPEGMNGQHTFVRRYFFPCWSYLDQGIPVTCDHQNDLIEETSMMQSLEVNFVE